MMTKPLHMTKAMVLKQAGLTGSYAEAKRKLSSEGWQRLCLCVDEYNRLSRSFLRWARYSGDEDGYRGNYLDYLNGFAWEVEMDLRRKPLDCHKET